MRHFLQIIAITLSLLHTHPGLALDTRSHRQLVVSLVDSWADFHATLYRFELADGKWLRVGDGVPAVVGKGGVAWDGTKAGRAPGWPVKKEGDSRAPAGIFPLSGAMGLPPYSSARTSLPFRAITPGTHCVDDPTSRYYNRIVTEKELPAPAAELWRSSERMWELPDLYRLLLVVDYNTANPLPGNGSCIFIHVWGDRERGTAGCTAMAESDLAEMAAWLKPEARPALVQLPVEAYRQVWRGWQLPSPELMNLKREKERQSLVDVGAIAPEVIVEMRYARPDNFTGQSVYTCGRCFLRRETVAKVVKAARLLRDKGLTLKLWDCYRPLSVQKLFWAIVPDPRFVADPKKGSRHNRGNAVDVTLADNAGHNLEMPTGFDDFSPRASQRATDLPAKALANRRLLAETMRAAGFSPLDSEWWHYDDAGADGELLDVSFDELCR